MSLASSSFLLPSLAASGGFDSDSCSDAYLIDAGPEHCCKALKMWGFIRTPINPHIDLCTHRRNWATESSSPRCHGVSEATPLREEVGGALHSCASSPELQPQCKTPPDALEPGAVACDLENLPRCLEMPFRPCLDHMGLWARAGDWGP